jgi:hypothetical protein
MSADTNQKTRGATVERAAPIYRALVTALEHRRLQLGWSAWQLDDAAGTQDGYWMKSLWADTPSGRQSNWSTIDLLVSALYPDGYEVQILPKKSPYLSALKQRSKIAAAAAFHRGDRTLREHMKELGRRGGIKGGKARAERLGKRRLRAIGKAGAQARWSKPRVTELTGEAADRARASSRR